MNKGPMGPRGAGKKAPKGALKKVIQYLAKRNKPQLIIVAICLAVSAMVSSSSGIFVQRIMNDVIVEGLKLESFDAVSGTLTTLLIIIGSLATLSVIASLTYTRIMAGLTQKVMYELRCEMFNKMQSLPVKYFDQNPHGDIMSAYTNDIDALRQFLSQTLVALITTSITICFVLSSMLYSSFILTGIVIFGVVIIFTFTKKIAQSMGKFFGKQQHNMGELEGFVEEMMEGQRVVKVFNYEDKAMSRFDELNEKLQSSSAEANKRGNILMPVLNNMGNLIYITVVIVGSLMITYNIPNISIGYFFSSNLEIAAVVAGFILMAKQLTSAISQISQQLPMFGMALAGSKRIFDLIEEAPETDDGYVTMVKGYMENDNFVETNNHNDKWYWKYPHQSYDGTTYHEVKGDIVLENVDFGYVPEKLVLKNISVYANPGEKIALVGSTGAGKTTITNIINRFYDIADGKCRFDGININKIKKYDLRRSLGVVLQDTNLFTGTVFENIAYGVENATLEQVEAAAKTANAYEFITRLPDGFNTILENNASNLSQGQRQLLSIARAACADTPVMILDEATSSIDTRTEVLVQQGMNQLMEGRTVFVIAHRLSTIKNSDCIMVLENGNVIEKGNHASLIKDKKTYYSFYTGKIELT
ncbi:MAG: ABC transporter ATP-binding protein [Mycoplasmatota bacterium]